MDVPSVNGMDSNPNSFDKLSEGKISAIIFTFISIMAFFHPIMGGNCLS